MSSDQPARDAFHWLGFGMAAVDALREAAPIEASEGNVQIRRAGGGGSGSGGRAAGLVWRIICLVRRSSGSTSVRPWKICSAASEARLWLAYDRDQAVGLSGLVRDYEEGCAILQDEDTIELEPAFVKAGWRREGGGEGAAQPLPSSRLSRRIKRVGVDSIGERLGGPVLEQRSAFRAGVLLAGQVGRRPRVDCHLPCWGLTVETTGKSIPLQYRLQHLDLDERIF